MRKFLRKSYPALLLFLTLSFTDIEHDESITKLLGSWEYLAPNIGMTFQKGAIEFSFEQEVLKGNVIFDNAEHEFVMQWDFDVKATQEFTVRTILPPRSLCFS